MIRGERLHGTASEREPAGVLASTVRSDWGELRRVRRGRMAALANLEQFLDEVSGKANALLAAESPYERGLDLSSFGATNASDPELAESAMPLWLMWGSLTDAIDGPGAGDPEVVAWGMDGLRRAAVEWLALEDEPECRRRYFDRWVYDECGYQRPGAEEST